MSHYGDGIRSLYHTPLHRNRPSADGQYVKVTDIRNSLQQWHKEEDLLSTSGVRTITYDIN